MSQYSAIDNSATLIKGQKATDLTGKVLWIVTMAIVMLSQAPVRNCQRNTVQRNGHSPGHVPREWVKNESILTEHLARSQPIRLPRWDRINLVT